MVMLVLHACAGPTAQTIAAQAKFLDIVDVLAVAIMTSVSATSPVGAALAMEGQWEGEWV